MRVLERASHLSCNSTSSFRAAGESYGPSLPYHFPLDKSMGMKGIYLHMREIT